MFPKTFSSLKFSLWLLLFLLVLSLAACGGGSPAPQEAPAQEVSQAVVQVEQEAAAPDARTLERRRQLQPGY